MTRRRRTKAQMLTAAIALLAGITLASQWGALTTRADGTPNPVPKYVQREQLRVLDSLTVAPEHVGGYDRALFGQRWKDTDRNGCDQRNDVLARDLTDVTLRAGSACVVVSGRLDDPYTGKQITFTKTSASAVQIDHVVPLAEAWRSGAHAWTLEQRETFANDTAFLLAVDGPANASKGDKGPEDWLPASRAAACRYATIYVTGKAKYRLTVTGPEKDSLRVTLTEACR